MNSAASDSIEDDQSPAESGYLFLDEMLAEAVHTCRILAPFSKELDLSPVESAVADLVPTSLSIAASIGQLLSVGYIPSARILVRPLMERAATVDYIVNDPAGTELWQAGWDYKRRPSFLTLFARMTGVDEPDRELLRLVVDDFNSVVHAEPGGCRKFVFAHPQHGSVYSLGRVSGAEEMASNTAAATAMAVTFLASNAKRAFRSRVATYSRDPDGERH